MVDQISPWLLKHIKTIFNAYRDQINQYQIGILFEEGFLEKGENIIYVIWRKWPKFDENSTALCELLKIVFFSERVNCIIKTKS